MNTTPLLATALTALFLRGEKSAGWYAAVLCVVAGMALITTGSWIAKRYDFIVSQQSISETALRSLGFRVLST